MLSHNSICPKDLISNHRLLHQFEKIVSTKPSTGFLSPRTSGHNLYVALNDWLELDDNKYTVNPQKKCFGTLEKNLSTRPEDPRCRVWILCALGAVCWDQACLRFSTNAQLNPKLDQMRFLGNCLLASPCAEPFKLSISTNLEETELDPLKTWGSASTSKSKFSLKHLTFQSKSDVTFPRSQSLAAPPPFPGQVDYPVLSLVFWSVLNPEIGASNQRIC